MRGLLDAKSAEIGRFLCMALVVYLGYGVLHPIEVLFLSKISFLGEV